MAASSRSYHTIGEVLNVLKADFPDVSISKIRFLESQGLLHPERTPSGYRRFQEEDVERLRFVLREQRDKFLPLKVIRTRLAAWERGELADATADGGETDVAEEIEMVVGDTGEQYTLRELAAAVGLSEDDVLELENYRLFEGHQVGPGEPVYDDSALLVARIARGFLKYGVEARHLRMFRQAADRETALFEQILSPILAQRNPEARRQASAALADLATLARKLHQVLLAQNIRTNDRV